MHKNMCFLSLIKIRPLMWLNSIFNSIQKQHITVTYSTIWAGQNTSATWQRRISQAQVQHLLWSISMMFTSLNMESGSCSPQLSDNPPVVQHLKSWMFAELANEWPEAVYQHYKANLLANAGVKFHITNTASIHDSNMKSCTTGELSLICGERLQTTGSCSLLCSHSDLQTVQIIL